MEPELFADRFQPSTDEIVNGLYGDLYVYVDGRFLKGAKARVPVFDHGLLYGDGVFEGIRAYGGRIFKLKEHLDRLYDSAKALMISIPLTRDEFETVIKQLLELNQLQDAHIRPIVHGTEDNVVQRLSERAVWYSHGNPCQGPFTRYEV